MTAAIRPVEFCLSANDRFKLGYGRTMKAATLAALVLTAVMVWLSPPYAPTPYVMHEPDYPCPIWIEEAPRVEEPAQPAPPPVIPPDFELVEDEGDADPFTFPEWETIWNPPPPPAPTGGYENFVASSAKPELTFHVRADYPEIARHAGIEGTVLVHVLVGPDGKVIDAVVVRGVHPLLDRAAARAARLCRFTPAKQRETPVKAWVAVPYRFSLR